MPLPLQVLNPELVKGPWTAEEDAKVIELVKMHGAKKWTTIANCLPGRIGKQCRERWVDLLARLRDPSSSSHAEAGGRSGAPRTGGITT